MVARPSVSKSLRAKWIGTSQLIASIVQSTIGAQTYEEITILFLDRADAVPEPNAEVE